MDTNVSQAIKMAGGVLIALIIIATLTYFFRELTPFQQQIEDIEALEQTAEFNKQYEVYNKSLMLGVDLISVLNKAASNNKAYIDAYGTGDSLRKNYLIDIEFELKTDNFEMLQVFKIGASGKEEEIFDSYQNAFGDKSTSYKEEIFPLIGNPSEQDKLWKRQEVIKLPKGKYTLLDSNNKTKKYCTDNVYDNIIVNATNLKKPAKNTGSIEIGEWSQAILNTSAYNLKTKKFKCTNVENSEITGRIIKMTFEEIQ